METLLRFEPTLLGTFGKTMPIKKRLETGPITIPNTSEVRANMLAPISIGRKERAVTIAPNTTPMQIGISIHFYTWIENVWCVRMHEN